MVYALCAISLTDESLIVYRVAEVGRFAHDDDDADDSFCVRGAHHVCLIVIT